MEVEYQRPTLGINTQGITRKKDNDTFSEEKFTTLSNNHLYKEQFNLKTLKNSLDLEFWHLPIYFFVIIYLIHVLIILTINYSSSYYQN